MSTDKTSPTQSRHSQRKPPPGTRGPVIAPLPHIGPKRGRPTIAASGVAMTPSELQKNYRLRQRSKSIDLPLDVMDELHAWRAKTGETNATLILRSLQLLGASQEFHTETIRPSLEKARANPDPEPVGVHQATTSQNKRKPATAVQQAPRAEQTATTITAREQSATPPGPTLPEAKVPGRKKAIDLAGPQRSVAAEQPVTLSATPSGNTEIQESNASQPARRPPRIDNIPKGQFELFK